jgi:hypothetical protein
MAFRTAREGAWKRFGATSHLLAAASRPAPCSGTLRLFTGCPQASDNGPATEQRTSAYPAVLPIWWSWSDYGH